MSNIVFGWIPPEDRTQEQKVINDSLIAKMPEFKLIGNGYWKEKEKGLLWDCSKSIYGKHLPAFFQEVGSCVGQGKAKVEWYLMFCEKVMNGDREKPVMPYEPYGYAQSRVCAGINGGGDGSTGTGAAEAAKSYGVLNSELDDLPKWKTRENEIVWPGSIDQQWGRAGAPSKWISEGKKHLVKTTALIRDKDKAVEALSNGYPIAIASNWGGMMNPPLKGDKFPVRLNKRTTTWNHQMCVTNFWFHPELGLIFWIQNSWGPGAHGDSPDDSPAGGFWVLPNELEYIMNQREAFAYSQFDGFPEQDLDKALFDLIGK